MDACTAQHHLQTLDGALCHNGEFAQLPCVWALPIHSRNSKRRSSVARTTEGEKNCALDLVGCVVRVSDMIAYLGKVAGSHGRGIIGTHTSSFQSLGRTNGRSSTT
jgi:hypothetical protein